MPIVWLFKDWTDEWISYEMYTGQGWSSVVTLHLINQLGAVDYIVNSLRMVNWVWIGCLFSGETLQDQDGRPLIKDNRLKTSQFFPAAHKLISFIVNHFSVRGCSWFWDVCKVKKTSLLVKLLPLLISASSEKEALKHEENNNLNLDTL